MRLLPVLILFAFFLPQEHAPQRRLSDAEREKLIRDAQQQGQKDTEQAVHINELAASIRSEQDAEKYVDAIRDVFGDELPRWGTRELTGRVAKAEYAGVVRHELVPDDRIAAAFNELVNEIGAPEWARVTGQEIYAMRDAHYSIAKISSAHGNLNIWLMPNMYAVELDGKVSPGARPVEALYVLYMLNEMFDNLISARELVRQGKLTSQLIEEGRQNAREGAASDRNSKFELRPATTFQRSYQDELRGYQYE